MTIPPFLKWGHSENWNAIKIFTFISAACSLSVTSHIGGQQILKRQGKRFAHWTKEARCLCEGTVRALYRGFPGLTQINYQWPISLHCVSDGINLDLNVTLSHNLSIWKPTVTRSQLIASLHCPSDPTMCIDFSIHINIQLNYNSKLTTLSFSTWQAHIERSFWSQLTHFFGCRVLIFLNQGWFSNIILQEIPRQK